MTTEKIPVPGTERVDPSTHYKIEVGSQRVEVQGTTEDVLVISEIPITYQPAATDIPNIPPPPASVDRAVDIASGITAADIAFQIQNFEITAQAKAVLAILDEWGKSIQAEAERIKERLNSPAYLAEQQAKSQEFQSQQLQGSTLAMEQAVVSSPDYQALVMQQKTLTVFADGISNYRNAVVNDPSTSKDIVLLGATFILGSTMVGNNFIVKEVVNPKNIELSTLRSMTENSAVGTPDFRAELGLLGATLMGITMNRLNAENLMADKLKGSPKDIDRKYAERYAQAMIDLLRSSMLDHMISGMVSSKSAPGKEESSKLSARAKIILLASALALMYKTELGGISGGEFDAMVDKTFKEPFPPGDLRNEIVALLTGAPPSEKNPSGYVGFLNQMGDKEGKLLRQALHEFMDSDPDVSILVRPSKMLAPSDEKVTLHSRT